MTSLKSLLLGSALALTAGSALAASHIMAIDADGDGMLTEAELDAVNSNMNSAIVFTAADSDGDGMLSEAEYNDAAFAEADEDDSNSLDLEEGRRFRELTRGF